MEVLFKDWSKEVHKDGYLPCLESYNSFSSVQLGYPSCATFWCPMNSSMPDIPVHHQLPEFIQTHVHWVDDVIKSSHPLSSPYPPAFNLSQHQGLFQWVRSLHQVAKVLEFQLQHQSFQWIFRADSFRMDWLDLLAVQESLSTLLQYHSLEHQFFGAQLSL